MSDLPTTCPTPDCPGDTRYAAPGRRHLKGCTYPLNIGGFCFDCPDHEGCSTGYPCELVRRVNGGAR